MTTLAKEAPPQPEAPYRGIDPFRFIDQKIFPARDEETWDLLSNVLIYRGVLLYGDSGSGKSSLINAGLIPAAAKENLVAHRLRIQPWRGREIKLERIPTESDNRPPYLPSVFVEAGSSKDKDMSLEISLADFYERVNKLRKQPAGKSRPLLIFDQFEEFITLFEEARHGGETPEAKGAQREAPEVQEEILHTLNTLMEDEELPVKILFVFREEYLAKLNLLFKACPELLNQYVRLLPPRVEVAEEIIRAPFLDEELRTKFTGEGTGQRGTEIPESLAASIARQLEKRSESGFLNLTELQIVCRRLWESHDPISFFQGKDSDIQRVLEDYWADVLAKLGNLYDPAIALLGHMVTSSNTRNIVSEPDLKYHEKDNFTPEQIDSALEALVERIKLVRREPRHKIYFYEIASEFLVPWIQQKKTARLAQIEAHKLAADTEQKLKQAASEQKLKQAQRERRNLLIGATILGSLLVVAVFLAFYSFRQQRVAVEAQRAADKARVDVQREKDESDNLVRLMNQLTNEDAQLRLAAVRDLVVLDQNGKLPRGLVQIVVAIMLDEGNKEISNAASHFFFALKAEDAINPVGSGVNETILKTAEEKNPELTSSKLPPRVYIQIASGDQQVRADKVANALRSAGFTVPAYEVVGDRAPKTNQLRYYKSVDESESSAGRSNLDQALQKIKDADGADWSTVGLQRAASVRPGHFEIWFASDSVPTQTEVPTPRTQVTLKLSYMNEQGQRLPISNPLVTLEPNPFVAGRTIIRNSDSISARPGEYLLFIQVPEYAVYRSQITLQGNEVTHVVKLKPKRSYK